MGESEGERESAGEPRLDRLGAWTFGHLIRRPLAGALFPAVVLALLLVGRLATHDLPALALACHLLLLAMGAFALATLFGMRRVQRRLVGAEEAGDARAFRALRALIEGGAAPRTAREAALRAVGEGELLLMEERWDEARDAFARVVREDLPAITRPGILGELGLATAHAGDPVRGAELALRALGEADAQLVYPKVKRFHLLLRAGIALVLAGEHTRGARLLFDALETEAGRARELGALCFFLASSFRALADGEEALRWLALAARTRGPWAERAKVALDEAKRAPHREGGGPLLVYPLAGLGLRVEVHPHATADEGDALLEADDDEKRAAST